MKSYLIKKTFKKGECLFANRNIKKGEMILHTDLTKLKSYSEKEINNNPKLQSDHCDYVGKMRYVIDDSPHSYMNHSCNPNTVVKHKTIAIKDTIAFRDIKKGEELTHDYTAGAFDQIETNNPWKMKCNCGNKNCRKIITGNFFKLPLKLQRKYYSYLPSSIKRKYKEKFQKLK